MNNVYQEQREIAELCGCEWDGVLEWFDGMTIEQIENEVNKCWPHEEGNAEFAQRVYEAVNNE